MEPFPDRRGEPMRMPAAEATQASAASVFSVFIKNDTADFE